MAHMGSGVLAGRPALAAFGALGLLLFGVVVAFRPQLRPDDQGSPPVLGVDWALARAGLPRSAYRSARHVIDPLIAALLLVIALPFIALIALAVKLDSPGPVLFCHLRGGELARPFTMLKFRTMRRGTRPFSEKVGEDDPRITRVGRLLRRTGLDELPQLWNVLAGDMALIGPRPEQYELLSAYEPWQHERHLVRPGLTGWWQVNHRDARPMRQNVERDLHYVRNQCLALDAVIVVRTVRIMLSGFRHSAQPRRQDQPATDP